MEFSDLGLSPGVLKAVEDAGYVRPTPIQEKAIPLILMGRDLLGTAQTGTGKTAGFTLPMIDILAVGQAKARMARSLILEPTRELAAQVAENFEIYGKQHRLSMALLIGGVSFDDQIRKLERGVDVLIATPGRLLDHFERGRLLLGGIKILVIDEADRMMDMGFMPDVERIVSYLPKIRQTLLFSATMPAEIRRLADAFLSNPKEVAVDPPTSPAETVVQGLAVVPTYPKDKRAALRRLLEVEDVKNALIFCNRKRDVDVLFRSLRKHGFDVAALHGDMDQASRTETLRRFKDGEVSLVVCSDVAARGLDIKGMSHVFNFDVPTHAEDYIHRIGRTGRAGLTGRAFTLATPLDTKYVEAIQHLIGRTIPVIEIEGVEKLDLDEYDDRRRGRRRGRGRGGSGKPASGRGRTKPPAEPPAATPSEAAPAAKKDQPADKGRKAKPKPERDRTGAKKPAKRTRGADKKTAEHEPPVVGLGDHVPEFLRRPARKRK